MRRFFLIVTSFVGAGLLTAGSCGEDAGDSAAGAASGALAAPSNLNAVATTSALIDLSWQDNSSNETGFEIYRSTDAVTFALLTTTVANTIVYADTSVSPSTTYTYKVRAVNTAGPSDFTSTASATTPAGIPAPTNLVGSVTSSTVITLTWTYADTGAIYYEVWHGTDGVSFQQLSPDPTGTTFDHNNPGSGQHYYRVRAVDTTPNPDASSLYSSTTLVVMAAPIAPTNLAAAPISSGAVKLTWTDNSSNEQGFTIYRSFTGGSGSFFAVGKTNPNVPQFTDSGLFPSTTYWYRVTAFNSSGSADSNTTSATTFSGDWIELGGSASQGGISNTTAHSSSSSVAVDKFGRIVVVWQETVLGVDQIYLAVWDTNIGSWKGVLVNGTLYSETIDTTSGYITAVTYNPQQLSNQGNGISQSAGDAEEPVIVYADDFFFIVWQEFRSGNWEIMTRKMDGLWFSAVNGFFRAQWDDVVPTVLNNNTAPNKDVDDNVTTGSATTQISTTVAGQASLHPQATVSATDLYVVWEEYLSENWEIYGRKVAATGFAVSAIGTGSDSGGGISATPDPGLPGEPDPRGDSRYPTISLSGTTAYVFWQELVDTTSDNWEIYAKRSLAAAAFAEPFVGALNVSNNTGDSMHPKSAKDPSGRPYVVWDDNSANSNNFDIYIVRLNSGSTAWEEIIDTAVPPTITVSKSGGGISNSAGSSQWPSISIDTGGGNVYVAWGDSTPGNWEIYVKQFAVSVPGEATAWVSMGISDVPPGVSNTAGSSLLPTIRVDAGGIVHLVWEDDTKGNFETFLRRW